MKIRIVNYNFKNKNIYSNFSVLCVRNRDNRVRFLYEGEQITKAINENNS